MVYPVVCIGIDQRGDHRHSFVPSVSKSVSQSISQPVRGGGVPTGAVVAKVYAPAGRDNTAVCTAPISTPQVIDGVLFLGGVGRWGLYSQQLLLLLCFLCLVFAKMADLK